MKEITHDLNHDLTFYFNCVCHILRSMFRVLGIYNFAMLLNNAESADLLKTRAMLVSKTNSKHIAPLFTTYSRVQNIRRGTFINI